MSNQLQTFFLDPQVVSTTQLYQLGYLVGQTTYLTLGGGLGSFVWADHLRIYGVPATEITAIGVTSKPHGRYQRLCTNSQIPGQERLRSDSGSTPDNIWGWPGYAVREICHELKQGNWSKASQLGWQIFTETAISEAYTPRAQSVYRSIDREAKRIGWNRIWTYGRIRAIRKTDDGRYAVLYEQDGQAPQIMLASYLHMALGYPGLRFLPDLQEYRRQSGDQKHVVNAYEEHEHLYAHLAQRGGVVMLRGRGIVASRILQRLHEVQQAHPNVKIHVVHLMREPRTEHTAYKRSQRTTENHWQYQPYNFPKACFTGDLRFAFEGIAAEERPNLISTWAGTTTADRRDWRDIVQNGLQAGWYQIRFGNVEEVVQAESGQLSATIQAKSELDEQNRFLADFIIDCTGLNAKLDANPIMRDLLEHYPLRKNPLGNLLVSSDFEVEDLRNGDGRVYASGVMTLGGPFGPVDSFLGLQYAAHRSVETLAQIQAPHTRRLTSMRSAIQWMHWAGRRAP